MKTCQVGPFFGKRMPLVMIVVIHSLLLHGRKPVNLNHMYLECISVSNYLLTGAGFLNHIDSKDRKIIAGTLLWFRVQSTKQKWLWCIIGIFYTFAHVDTADDCPTASTLFLQEHPLTLMHSSTSSNGSLLQQQVLLWLAHFCRMYSSIYRYTQYITISILHVVLSCLIHFPQ